MPGRENTRVAKRVRVDHEEGVTKSIKQDLERKKDEKVDTVEEESSEGEQDSSEGEEGSDAEEGASSDEEEESDNGEEESDEEEEESDGHGRENEGEDESEGEEGGSEGEEDESEEDESENEGERISTSNISNGETSSSARGVDSTYDSRLQPSHVRNKIKRSELMSRLRHEKAKEKKKRLKKRNKEEEAARAQGLPVPPRKEQRTIESAREFDEEEEKRQEENLPSDVEHDEFADYFSEVSTPKLLITTSYKATKATYEFIKELISIIPNAHYYKRGGFRVKQIVQFATNREFTNLMVVNENRKQPNALLLIHLPFGPTALFKLTSLVPGKKIRNHGTPTLHYPELILNNFGTKLGERMGRHFSSLFPQRPQYKGRRVVTLHNQRDFIFFRHHRYIFEARDSKSSRSGNLLEGPKKEKKRKREKVEGEGEKVREEEETPKEVIARLQECGPRFTLKLESLQRGTFDSKHGEFDWLKTAKIDGNKRKFCL